MYEIYTNNRTTFGWSFKNLFKHSNRNKLISCDIVEQPQQINNNSQYGDTSLYGSKTYRVVSKVMDKGSLIYHIKIFPVEFQKYANYEKTKDAKFQIKQRRYFTHLGLHIYLSNKLF